MTSEPELLELDPVAELTCRVPSMSLDDALAHVAGELDSVPRLEPAIEEVAELVTNAADRYSFRGARTPAIWIGYSSKTGVANDEMSGHSDTGRVRGVDHTS